MKRAVDDAWRLSPSQRQALLVAARHYPESVYSSNRNGSTCIAAGPARVLRRLGLLASMGDPLRPHLYPWYFATEAGRTLAASVSGPDNIGGATGPVNVVVGPAVSPSEPQ